MIRILALFLFVSPVFAETPEEIHDRVNENWWNTKNQCYLTAQDKWIEFMKSGYEASIYIIRIPNRTGRTKHAILEYEGVCYDDLQGLTSGIVPCVDVLRQYPLVRIE